MCRPHTRIDWSEAKRKLFASQQRRSTEKPASREEKASQPEEKVWVKQRREGKQRPERMCEINQSFQSIESGDMSCARQK